jgi:SAM-dependent methyltransferase
MTVQTDPSTAYIHGTAVSERARLDDLNRLTNRSFVDYLNLPSDAVVADLGCGPGTLEVEIATRYSGVRLTGIERSDSYCATACQRTAHLPNVDIRQGDASATGLPDNTFDVTFCRYLLEHVASASDVAREMVRITKPGGRIIAQENDLLYVVYYPEIPGHDEVMKQFCWLQVQLGGDPFVGRRLFSLFDRDGVERIDLDISVENYTALEPAAFRAWLSNSLRILQGARPALLDRGLLDRNTLDAPLAAMQARIDRPEGVALFHWDRATAVKKGGTPTQSPSPAEP